jgi:hypothetical protein
MRKVTNMDEMKKERMRLKSERNRLEMEIENDIDEIKTIFTPVAMAKKGLGKIVSKPEKKDLLSATGGMLAEWMMKKIILRNAGFVKRWLISKGTANLLSHLIHKNQGPIYTKLGNFLMKLRGSRPHESEVNPV